MLNQESSKLFWKYAELRRPPNASTFFCMLKVHSMIRSINKGREIHVDMLEGGYYRSRYYSWQCITLYIFWMWFIWWGTRFYSYFFIFLTLYLWNVLIAGYVQRGEGSKAKTYFKRMQCDHFVPNTVTSICIFKACSRLGALHRGRTQKVLKGLPIRIVASWNALISGY